MDADTWVQDFAGVRCVLDAAAGGALAAAPEVHRSYNDPDTELRVERVLGIPYRVTSYWFRRLKDIYGTATARALFDKPVLNAGVFGLAADAPHWDAWRRTYRESLLGTRRRPLDQLSLNTMAYTAGLPVARLPATSNWVVHRALPMVDGDRLVVPDYPHETIGVVHLTVGTKYEEHELRVRGGGTIRRTLHYA